LLPGVLIPSEQGNSCDLFLISNVAVEGIRLLAIVTALRTLSMGLVSENHVRIAVMALVVLNIVMIYQQS
jgi:hypothetical protein